jgi:hypothetical protein
MLRTRLVLVALALAALSAMGCSPKIGDKCQQSTDCSVSGGRLCDTAQPGGYCTILNCSGGSCPDHAICVAFQTSIPGCPYDDYRSPARTARSFCMAHCSQDSDCRTSAGYVCRDPTEAPWNASNLEADQSQGVCIVAPGLLAEDGGFDYSAPVCATGPLDAAIASGGDASADGSAPADASADGAASDASLDGSAQSDGALDGAAAGDASADGSTAGDGEIPDAGAPDAPVSG